MNYNATANSYDPTGGNGTRELCYGAYCTSSGSVPTQPLSLEQNVTLCPYTDAAGEHDGSCTCDDGSAPVVYGPGDNSLDECRGSTVDQCLSSVHRLCNPLTGEAGSPPNVTGDCGPRQAFSCMDAADTVLSHLIHIKHKIQSVSARRLSGLVFELLPKIFACICRRILRVSTQIHIGLVTTRADAPMILVDLTLSSRIVRGI
eukprot:SAG31_NODE_425_length_15822_cov_10.580758_11_plen_203_part_00